MGYTTYFDGSVTIEPPLNEDEISFLSDLSSTRRMNRTRGPLFVKGSGDYGQGSDDDIIDYNAPHLDQPGLWCHWIPNVDGARADSELTWDGGEKFYEADKWMQYIVQRLLAPEARDYINTHINEDERLQNFTCNHMVNGTIFADGEEGDDFWALEVENNKVFFLEGQVVYPSRRELVLEEGKVEFKEPEEGEVAAAVHSIRTAVRKGGNT